MLKAAIYARRSKQSRESESISTQISACKKYALSHDIMDCVEYIDDGYSGGSIQRPSFNKLLNDINHNVFDVLICYRLDRVSRNINDFTNILSVLEEKNISFVSIKESFDTSTPMGRAMIYIASVFSQLERDTIAERIKDNMYFLAETGRWLGGNTPYGYHANRLSTHSVLEAVDEELRNVSLLYNRFSDIKSIKRLRKWSQSMGLKTREHKTFSESSLRFILSNPVYVINDLDIYDYFNSKKVAYLDFKSLFDSKNSIIAFNRHRVTSSANNLKDISEWIVARGNHKGIVTGKQWIEVQKILNSKGYFPKQGSDYCLLSGYIVCDKCDCRLRTISTKVGNKVYRYYRCPICSVSVPSRKCDDTVLSILSSTSVDIVKLQDSILNGINNTLEYKFDDYTTIPNLTKELILRMFNPIKLANNSLIITLKDINEKELTRKNLTKFF